MTFSPKHPRNSNSHSIRTNSAPKSPCSLTYGGVDSLYYQSVLIIACEIDSTAFIFSEKKNQVMPSCSPQKSPNNALHCLLHNSPELQGYVTFSHIYTFNSPDLTTNIRCRIRSKRCNIRCHINMFIEYNRDVGEYGIYYPFFTAGRSLEIHEIKWNSGT